jgi:hypothetical protein
MVTLLGATGQATGVGSLTSLSPAALELVRYAVQHPTWLDEMLELAAVNSIEAWKLLEEKAGQSLNERDRELFLMLADLFLSPDTLIISNENTNQIWTNSDHYPPDLLPWLRL